MPVLDFTEIPEAHLAKGHQDTFELFARDFFKFAGYEIAEEPDRGADGGSDITLLERRLGVGGETQVRWLVSCKHKASSGRSVSPTDDRISVIGLGPMVAMVSLGFIQHYPVLA